MGAGRTIFENPLMNGIERHLGRALRDTAFLSFTEDLSIAYAYGASNYHLRKEEIEHDFLEYRGADPQWDFALLTLHTRHIAWEPLVKGFYQGYYLLEGAAAAGWGGTGAVVEREAAGDAGTGGAVGRVNAGMGARETVRARMLLVDVAAVLKDWRNHDVPYTKSYMAAVRDREWLLLPDIEFPDRTGGPGAADTIGVLEGTHLTINTMMRKGNGKYQG